ncbi:caspase family protein [Rhizobium ruizarguesonis]|uniref:caspase family protein n=1 Tax=Rhizobium ruizarguesonis TaxID=2081791 RepID=UPI0013EEB29A|nr:caspase family protein [Rhizobium ruizarguesonis]
MKNWAIIVGINEYPQSANQNPLRGAVADAVDFADWALHPDGGNVDPDNLFLWTYPPPAPGTCSERVEQYNQNPSAWSNGFDQIQPSGDRAPFVEEIFRTAWTAARGAASELREDGTEGRCFVFLAGHGVQGKARFDIVPQTCFLAGDFQEDGPVNGLVPSEDLRVGLLSCGFAQVFMFLDCCRLNLVRFNSVVRNLNFPSDPYPDTAIWGAGFAAERNSVAWETPAGNPSRGAFSKILLEGLRRVRDPATGILSVRALEDYVANRIQAMVRPNEQYPYFVGDPSPSRLVIVNAPPIPLGDEDIVVDFGAIPPGTNVYLKDAKGQMLATLSARAGGERVAAQLGRLYSLETQGGAVEHGFQHTGPGVTHVQL